MLLEVGNLHVSFDSPGGVVRAVQDLSFSLGDGERMGILGESGSGKSVTALAIMGLLPRRHCLIDGSIRLNGEELVGKSERELARRRGRNMALIFQDPLSALNPVYTIGRQIGEMFQRHCGASRRESRSKSIELMERVEIPHADSRVDDYPHQFSGGMRQRAMIAIALSLSPSLLIADEPTTALDVTVQAEILGLLRRISAQDGTALILISHDLGVVASTAEHIAVMYSGQVVEQGVTEHVYERPAHPYTRGLLRSLPGEDGGGRLQAIPGAPPDPLNTPSGCRFHPRCEWAQPECAAQIPELNLLSLAGVGARRSRCYFAEDVLRSG